LQGRLGARRRFTVSSATLQNREIDENRAQVGVEDMRTSPDFDGLQVVPTL